VKNFNVDKGFGFIEPDTGDDDVFVHHSEIQTSGFRKLMEGQRVEYKISEVRGRPQATQVTGPNGADLTQGEQRQERSYQDDNQRDERDEDEIPPPEGFQMGSVKTFNDEKGYGFIQPDDGGSDLFVHFRDIHANGYKNLARGERVQFSMRESGDGRAQAENVTGPGGKAVRGSQRQEQDNRDNYY